MFSTSVDRLPELKAYLSDLLLSRETILANDLLDEWATADAVPNDEEIDQVRRLVERAESLLGDLPQEERERVEAAATECRKVRAAMHEYRHSAPVYLRDRSGGQVLA